MPNITSVEQLALILFATKYGVALLCGLGSGAIAVWAAFLDRRAKRRRQR